MPTLLTDQHKRREVKRQEPRQERGCRTERRAEKHIEDPEQGDQQRSVDLASDHRSDDYPEREIDNGDCDRGGDSASNVKRAKKLGVKHVGIAPKGKKSWSVSERMANRIRRERAQVEGSIGTIKSARYGFNRPNARSKAAMARCGHKAILGFNMRKLTREWSNAQTIASMS